MMATQRLLLTAVALAVATLTSAAPTNAKDGGGSDSTATHRFGVGWDDGIGARYRLGRNWGVGMRVNPYLTDNESGSHGEHFETDENEVDARLREVETRNFGAAIMLFRESRIGRWLGFGPFGEVSYDRSRSRYSTDDMSNEVPPGEDAYDRLNSSLSVSRTWRISVGVRPTFTFGGRFALETRLGASLSFSNGDGESRSVTERRSNGALDYRDESLSRGEDRSWGASVFGEELGPGSTLTFIAYF